MAIHYCVLWIPTIFHDELSIISTKPIVKDISDNENSLKVTIEFESKTENILLRTSETEIIKLIQKAKSKNGLISYEFETNNNFLSEKIYNAVYHAVKSFYHCHEHHDPNVDSLLTPFISTYYVNIKEKNRR